MHALYLVGILLGEYIKSVDKFPLPESWYFITRKYFKFTEITF